MDATLQADVEITNVAQWCRDNGVDRRTFYRHRARITAEGSWQPRSRRPHRSPNATDAEVATLIVQLREQLAPDNGADAIRDRLAELAEAPEWAARGRTVPSRATINRILDRHGKLASNPRKRPKSSYRRFSYARPRDCYQIDGTQITVAGSTAVVIEVLDDCTRTLVATHVAARETAHAAITAFQQAVAEYGAPALVLADNGAAFTARYRHTDAPPGRFERTVTAHGTRLIHSSPYHPQTCGKVERHHHTFQQWLAFQPPPATLDELATLAKTYRRYYNTERRHSALPQRATPTQAWHAAPTHGAPTDLPRQTEATLHTRTVDKQGQIRLNRNLRLFIGRRHARTTITIIRDHDHITAYTTNGTPLGHTHLDHTHTWQGSLTPTT